ncbi:SOS response UmuD protein [Fluviicoccus keumensis]|uniref:SOS response UmuD protein n=1 Tax=Fluviicoccus keumensis TaxID=1435465 RepID=A0A4Q7Z4X1_9GAMM|nr:translesion error-prone DNA polymerase V autoproteolytic subunit [Fluviicoccus keumensis]RZU45367.1 SOS response UmuD protein [Fluviicoccus keumensis]HEX5277959.1 translesion error-prone DNA polymerase V autoproteolytic subunit [Fluviicoccus sp.]
MVSLTLIQPAHPEPPPGARPFYGYRIPAGFPSPADDYLEQALDANQLLAANKTATYYVRISGPSMQDAFVRDGDIAVVDCSKNPQPGNIVIAVVDGDMLVKRLQYGPGGHPELHPANPRFPVIRIRPEQDFLIWGVVTWTLHRHL